MIENTAQAAMIRSCTGASGEHCASSPGTGRRQVCPAAAALQSHVHFTDLKPAASHHKTTTCFVRCRRRDHLGCGGGRSRFSAPLEGHGGCCIWPPCCRRRAARSPSAPRRCCALTGSISFAKTGAVLSRCFNIVNALATTRCPTVQAGCPSLGAYAARRPHVARGTEAATLFAPAIAQVT